MTPGQRHHDRALRSAEGFLLPDEEVVVASNKHWVVIAEPVLTCVLSFALVVWVNVSTGSAGGDVFWWVWFAIVLRTAWCLLEWRRTWFIATDQRFLKITGMVVRKVAMMPLKKVTDITYDRTIPGQILRYGTFRFETAGQDQAFSKLERMPHPNEMYRAIVEYVLGGPPKAAPAKPAARPADPTPTRPMSFDFGNRPRGRDEALYRGGSPEREPSDKRHEGSGQRDPDTEPFVIPGEWKRTDNEVAPPKRTTRAASDTPNHLTGDPVQQSEASKVSARGMVDTGGHGSRGWWRKYKSEAPGAQTQGSSRGVPHELGHGRRLEESGPIIDVRGKRRRDGRSL